MRKYILIMLCMLVSYNYVLAADPAAPLIFSGSTPAQGATVSSLKTIVLTFDFSNVTALYPDIPEADWGIVSLMNGSTKSAKLYKGTDTSIDPVATAYKNVPQNSPDFAPGEPFEFRFENEVKLEAGETYTLLIPASCYYAATTTKKAANTALKQPITITFTGAAEQANVIMDSYSPSNETPLETLDKVSVKFSYSNYAMTLKDGGAQASLYDGENLLKSVDLTLNADDNTIIDINFDGEKLYNAHAYKIIIPENSIFPVDPASEAYLPEKGNKEVTITYAGANYKYDITARVSPGSGNEISWLGTVNATFKFPEGYNLGKSEVSAQLYKGDKETGQLIDTYAGTSLVDVKTMAFPIWKFDLEPGSTYTFVIGAKQIMPTGSSLSETLADTTNPEIVVTYTTPAVLETVEKLVFQSSDPADNAALDKLENISLAFARYSFENTDYAPVIADTEASATLYEVTGDGEKELQQVALAVTQANSGDYCAAATVGRTLYQGKTYKFRVPAGYFRPNNENLAIAANEAVEYTFTGTSDPYGLTTHKSSVTAGSSLSTLGLAAFYFDDEVTAAADAKIEIYKGEEKVKSVPVQIANQGDYTRVYADFCDAANNFAPFATEANTGYTLTLPKGSITSAADDNLQNETVTVVFTGIIPTEYVSIAYTLGDNARTESQTVKGNTVSYTFTLEPDWEVESLLFNGEEVKEDIQTGIYTTPALTENATLEAVLAYTGFTYTENSSGIVQIEGSNLTATSKNGEIVISGLNVNDEVTVYSIGGSVLGHYKATKDETHITLPQNATYLIKVNNVMIKLLNK